MKNIALIFPGQGAQKVGMGLDFYNNSPEAKAIFEQADQICANDLTRVMFEGPEEKLTSTAYCQPAILTMSVAALKAFEAHPNYKNFSVKFTAGLSLGEYSALCASGVMNFADTLRLVQQRAAFMEEATKENQGAMAAVIGFDVTKLVEICRQTGAQIANFNSHEQIVITGHKAKVDAAIEAIKVIDNLSFPRKRESTTKIIPLAVSGAFHSSLMSSASSKFEAALKEVSIKPPFVPVLSNVTGQPHYIGVIPASSNVIPATSNVIPASSNVIPASSNVIPASSNVIPAKAGIQDTEQVRLNLARQITESVQWVKCVEYIASQGITNFIEIGPGRVLKGLMRRIDPAITVTNIEKPQDIETLA